MAWIDGEATLAGAILSQLVRSLYRVGLDGMTLRVWSAEMEAAPLEGPRLSKWNRRDATAIHLWVGAKRWPEGLRPLDLPVL